jgi:hypothetical protein
MRQLRVEQGAAPMGRHPAYGYAFLAFAPEIWGRQSRSRLVIYKFAIDYVGWRPSTCPIDKQTPIHEPIPSV